MPQKIPTLAGLPKPVDLTADFPKLTDKALVKGKDMPTQPMEEAVLMVGKARKAMPDTASPMVRLIFPPICSEVPVPVGVTGTQGVPVVVLSNCLLTEMACLPLEEASKQMGEMLPRTTTVQVVVDRVVPFVWRVVPSWHPVLSKPRVEADSPIHPVVVGASPSKPTAT